MKLFSKKTLVTFVMFCSAVCFGAPYQPGTPGGAWTPEEVRIMRERITKSVLHRPWTQIRDGAVEAFNRLYGEGGSKYFAGLSGDVSEAAILRLVFHDCTKYKDGTGGCDGCLNWSYMGDEWRNIFTDPARFYKPQRLTGDNNRLERVVKYLELLYTSPDYPESAPALKVSLKDSGKSRADLWQFAGLVALEQMIERANWGCDHDFNVRQQQTLLESREKCEIKLTKPFKFMYGRADCIPSAAMERKRTPFIVEKAEVHTGNWDSAKDVLAFMRSQYKMPAKEFIALSAIHGAGSGFRSLATKYSWLGYNYLGNMYLKMIANRPIYPEDRGGSIFLGTKKPGFFSTSVGDGEGKPLSTIGWRVSCSQWWNTTEGGPCYMRPTQRGNYGAPGSPGVTACSVCDGGIYCEGTKDYRANMTGLDANGNFLIRDSKDCKTASFTKNGVQLGGKARGRKKPKNGKHPSGWSNMFALPYEVGLYYKYDMGMPAHRPIGCPGLDTPVDQFPGKQGHFSIQSPIMDCGKNTDIPDGKGGKPAYQIVEELADDNEVWAESFIRGWEIFSSNGYDNLKPGPQESWMGFASLEAQGINVGNFEKYIKENSPVWFTNPNADPFVTPRTSASRTSQYLGIRSFKP